MKDQFSKAQALFLPGIFLLGFNIDTGSKARVRVYKSKNPGSQEIACIDEPSLIAKILEHVQKRTALASTTARGPPTHGGKALNLA